LLRDAISAGDTVIDATTGNGHDTVFLAQCVGEEGRVFAFDVQDAAIASASARVEVEGCASQVTFVHDSHRNLESHVDGVSRIAAIIFNLGYLPGDDHGKTTEAGETLQALGAAVRLLKQGGILAVVCYPGHDEGGREAAAVEDWMSGLTSLGWRVAKYQPLGTLRPAPFLLLASI
jgi:16S rRNA C1402 N4-methylase RsmH